MAEFKATHKLALLATVILVVVLIGYFAISGSISQPEPKAANFSPADLAEQQTKPLNVTATEPQRLEEPNETPVKNSTTSAVIAEDTVNEEKVTNARVETTTNQPPSSTSTQQSSSEQTNPNTDTQTSTVVETLPATQNAELPNKPSAFTDAELASWNEFRLAHNRIFANEGESLHRQAIFVNNYRFIQSFNERGDASFRLGVNRFADMTREEINARFVGPMRPHDQLINPPLFRFQTDGGEPQTVDWRNLTSPPVDQGECRDSGVFAAVASIESALSRTRLVEQPVKLSESHLLSCLAAHPPPGSAVPVCAGLISLKQIFEQLQQMPGLARAEEYLELVQRGAAGRGCELPPIGLTRVRLADFTPVHRDNFATAIISSPLSVSIDASQSTFHFYQSGLYHDENCSSEEFNHNALLVGLQADSFLLRNSFGPNWGESGFMRLLRDERNKCLPQRIAFYPNLAPV